MDRVPVDVQCCDPRGRDRDRGAVGGLQVVTDQRGFTRARLAGEEQVMTGMEVIERRLELLGDGESGGARRLQAQGGEPSGCGSGVRVRLGVRGRGNRRGGR